ncbi:hypothetical protein [Persephonella hydrogeniphila]|nr:hypothetical protein [Persephonella hydrogeniphila]
MENLGIIEKIFLLLSVLLIRDGLYDKYLIEKAEKVYKEMKEEMRGE